MNLLVASKHYPVTIARFFVTALRRAGHGVVTVGPYVEDGLMPWPGRPSFPAYDDPPDIRIYRRLRDFPVGLLDVDLAKFDAVISFDAGFRLTGPCRVPMVLYGTDPHAIDYGEFAQEYDLYLSAQRPNLDFPGQEHGIWLPLAYDPTVHRQIAPLAGRPVDICFVGVYEGPSYEMRKAALEMLAERHNVFMATGLIYEDYTVAYNRAKIAFNLSASWDHPMRNFEALGMGNCLLTERLPYFEELGLREDVDYAAFTGAEEMLDKAAWLLAGDARWQKIAESGHARAQELDMTYDARARQMIGLVEKLAVHA